MRPSEEFMNQWEHSRTEYSDKPVNPDYYKIIKISDLFQTVPPSEDPTIAPEHPNGLLDHSFKQKLVIPLKKERKSGKTKVNKIPKVNKIKK
jgi:hypothetical protein